MEGQGTASGPGQDADTAPVAGMAAAAARVPGWLPADGSSDSHAPEQELQAIADSLTRAGDWSASAGSQYEPLGRAPVFRPWPARSLHVVGESPLAAEFRRLLTAGSVPGWDLHPVPARRTALQVLAGPLHRLSGSNRFYNLLEREGFAYVEEVAATPDGCLLELRNSGMKFIAAVRQVLADRGFGGTQATTGSLPAPGDPERDPGGSAAPAGLPTEAARALQVVAAWAVAERGAQVLGDLLTLAPGAKDLPPDVAHSWARIRQLGLRPLAGTALPDDDLPQLARKLLGELEERRRLILTSRTFAPGRAHLRQPRRRSRRRPRARPPTRDLGPAATGARGRARPVPSAALARGLGRTARQRPRGAYPQRAAVDGPATVLAGQQNQPDGRVAQPQNHPRRGPQQPAHAIHRHDPADRRTGSNVLVLRG